MLYMRVYCDYCSGTFEVYPKLREYDKARQCPHCDSRIDGTTWREKILPAFNEVCEANLALARDHVDHHTALFEIAFIADGKFANAKDGYLP